MENLWLFVAFIVAVGTASLLMRRYGRASASDDPFAQRTRSTDVINMSSIRVAGVGGLAFVAVAIGIAIAIPRIGQTLIVGAIGGSLVAWAVIRYRRDHGGPLDSSHAQPGGRAMLVEQDPPASAGHPASDDVRTHPRARVSFS